MEGNNQDNEDPPSKPKNALSAYPLSVPGCIPWFECYPPTYIAKTAFCPMIRVLPEESNGVTRLYKRVQKFEDFVLLCTTFQEKPPEKVPLILDFRKSTIRP
jgi:hypothetical protein